MCGSLLALEGAFKTGTRSERRSDKLTGRAFDAVYAIKVD
jgi:hypothetical protein